MTNVITKFILSVVTALGLASMVTAQEREVRFGLPFDFPISFSGNFGELRADHFHGGLDFKTQGTIGKPVRAQSDGYVSRIRVNSGSGYVLNVTYNEGYYLIYRHLSRFTPEIDELVKKVQYENESWDGVDITPDKDEYPIKRGQVIAYSGNTGYSMGPHLHLDAIEISTDEYVDPLPFFITDVKDHIPPKAESFMLFPQRGAGVVDGKSANKSYLAGFGGRITAWGVIGVGVKAHDHMEGSNNVFGVKSVVLEVDGNEIFRSTVDRFSERENKYINSWTEGQYMKSFIEPGNKLRMLEALNGNRGLITIDEARPYKFVYTLTDGLGNKSTASFVVYGEKSEIDDVQTSDDSFFAWNKTNYFQRPGLDVFVPKGSLYDNLNIDYNMKGDSSSIANVYKLTKTAIPLHTGATVKIGLRKKPVSDMSKYYIARVAANGKTASVGGSYTEDGFMTASVSRLGTFTVCLDTIPPKIVAVNPAQWGRGGKIVLKAMDKETGVASFRGTIDGEYALFGKYNSYNGNIICVLDPEHVKKGGSHSLDFTVTDNCGNIATQHFTFTW